MKTTLIKKYMLELKELYDKELLTEVEAIVLFQDRLEEVYGRRAYYKQLYWEAA